jgi:tetratricopeptide (TPR) repeat protein
MVSKKQHSRLIDRYLDGNLDKRELQEFESELQKNPELRAELELQTSINDALKESDVIDFRSRLKTIHQGQMPSRVKEQHHGLGRRRTIQVAASVAILIISIFTAFWLGTDRSSNEALFEKYYEKYEPVNVRTGSPKIDEIFQKALKAYENQEFEMALVYFEEVLKMDRQRMEANLLSGVSNMELDAYQEAEDSFNAVIDHSNNLFVEEAEWYLAFCYLKTNKTAKAKLQFEKFSEGHSEKQETARKILRRLR